MSTAPHLARRPLRAGCRALLLASAVLAALSAGRAPASAEGASAVEDADYRFRLQSPGPGWRLLPEPEARRLVPDALAGAMLGQGVWGVVIVEEAGAVPLDMLARVVLDNMSLEDQEATEPEDVELLGRRGLRWRTSGRLNGVPMLYQHVVFLNQGFAYQLVTWGLASSVAADGSSFAPFVDAFWLLEGTPKGRAPSQTVRDATGVGWAVEDGVFRSAAYRLEVKPPEGWRLAIGQELQGMNSNAEIGLVSANPECYLILIVERASGEDHEAFLRHVETTFLAGVGGEPKPERVPASVDGRAFALREIAVAGPPAVEFFHGAFFEGDLCVQVLGWYLAPLRERARPKVLGGLAGIRFLDAPEAAALARKLEEGTDVQNRVAETWSIRRGTYRDFEHRLTWRKPPGWWRLRAGPAARAVNDLAVLHLEEPSRGILGLVLAEPVADMAPEAFYRLVVDHVFPDGAPGGEAEPFDLGDAVAYATSGRRKTDSMTFRWRVAAAVHGGKGYQFLFWGTVDNMKSAARAVEEALEGFRFHAELKPTTTADGGHRDDRLGYAMASLGEGWQIDTKDMTGVGALGSSAVWRLPGRQEVTLGALCTLEDGQDEAWMVDLLTRLVAEQAAKGLQGRAPTREPTTLAGLPAERLAWTAPHRVDVTLLRRDRTFYFLIFEHGRDPALTLDQVKSRFSLVD